MITDAKHMALGPGGESVRVKGSRKTPWSVVPRFFHISIKLMDCSDGEHVQSRLGVRHSAAIHGRGRRH